MNSKKAESALMKWPCTDYLNCLVPFCNSCGSWPLLESVLVKNYYDVCCSFGFSVKINHPVRPVMGVLSSTKRVSHK